MAKLFEVRVRVISTELHEVLATDEQNAMELVGAYGPEPVITNREEIEVLDATYVTDVPANYFDLDSEEDGY